MNFERLYEYRHRGVDQDARERVWGSIARDIHVRMGSPRRVLDPAAGRGEFIRAVPAEERWAIDQVHHTASAFEGVKLLVGDARTVDLPSDYFDGVLLSNFLEHLASQADVAAFLERMRVSIVTGGVVAVLGPNFRYTAREYFDCADHNVILTHVAVEEHLFAAGFEPFLTIPRYLPYSFRSRLPASVRMTDLYLRMPWAWRLLGKQFLVLGRL